MGKWVYHVTYNDSVSASQGIKETVTEWNLTQWESWEEERTERMIRHRRVRNEGDRKRKINEASTGQQTSFGALKEEKNVEM